MIVRYQLNNNLITGWILEPKAGEDLMPRNGNETVVTIPGKAIPAGNYVNYFYEPSIKQIIAGDPVVMPVTIEEKVAHLEDFLSGKFGDFEPRTIQP